jgi:hypothetical protein
MSANNAIIMISFFLVQRRDYRFDPNQYDIFQPPDALRFAANAGKKMRGATWTPRIDYACWHQLCL